MYLEFSKDFDRSESHQSSSTDRGLKYCLSVAGLVCELPLRSSACRLVWMYFIPAHSGVSQGSLLGPALFSLFINDISKQAKFILFADDVKVFCDVTSSRDTQLLQRTVLWPGAFKMKWN